MWHVAAHEIGHAIYGLDGVKDAIKVSTKTMLEEPRAELTALHTMTLLLPAGLLKKVRKLLGACNDSAPACKPAEEGGHPLCLTYRSGVSWRLHLQACSTCKRVEIRNEEVLEGSDRAPCLSQEYAKVADS